MFPAFSFNLWLRAKYCQLRGMTGNNLVVLNINMFFICSERGLAGRFWKPKEGS